MKHSIIFYASAIIIGSWLIASPVRAIDGDGSGPWVDQTLYTGVIGTLKNGQPIPAELHDPWNGGGVAEGFTDPTAIIPDNAGYALGYGGQVTYAFANTVLNQPGPDIQIFSVHDANFFAKRHIGYERVKVQVSQDGWTWHTIRAKGTGDMTLELGGTLKWARYIQLTDRTDPKYTKFSEDSNGYNLDGILALHSTADIPWIGEMHDMRFWRIDDNQANDEWLGHSIVKREPYPFCDNFWNQAVTLHNNWEANPTVGDISLQDTFFYTLGKSTFDGMPMTDLMEYVTNFQCDKLSSRDKEIVRLYTYIKKLNSNKIRYNYAWYTPTVTNVGQ